MTKYLLGFLCLLIVLISAAAVWMPASWVWFFATHDRELTLVQLGGMALLLSYALIPIIRFPAARTLLMVTSVVLGYLGIAGLLPNGLLGIHDFYPRPFDVLLSLLGSINTTLVALELPTVREHTNEDDTPVKPAIARRLGTAR